MIHRVEGLSREGFTGLIPGRLSREKFTGCIGGVAVAGGIHRNHRVEGLPREGIRIIHMIVTRGCHEKGCIPFKVEGLKWLSSHTPSDAHAWASTGTTAGGHGRQAEGLILPGCTGSILSRFTSQPDLHPRRIEEGAVRNRHNRTHARIRNRRNRIGNR